MQTSHPRFFINTTCLSAKKLHSYIYKFNAVVAMISKSQIARKHGIAAAFADFDRQLRMGALLKTVEISDFLELCSSDITAVQRHRRPVGIRTAQANIRLWFSQAKTVPLIQEASVRPAWIATPSAVAREDLIHVS